MFFFAVPDGFINTFSDVIIPDDVVIVDSNWQNMTVADVSANIAKWNSSSAPTVTKNSYGFTMRKGSVLWSYSVRHNYTALVARNSTTELSGITLQFPTVPESMTLNGSHRCGNAISDFSSNFEISIVTNNTIYLYAKCVGMHYEAGDYLYLNYHPTVYKTGYGGLTTSKTDGYSSQSTVMTYFTNSKIPNIVPDDLRNKPCTVHICQPTSGSATTAITSLIFHFK